MNARRLLPLVLAIHLVVVPSFLQATALGAAEATPCETVRGHYILSLNLPLLATLLAELRSLGRTPGDLASIFGARSEAARLKVPELPDVIDPDSDAGDRRTLQAVARWLWEEVILAQPGSFLGALPLSPRGELGRDRAPQEGVAELENLLERIGPLILDHDRDGTPLEPPVLSTGRTSVFLGLGNPDYKSLKRVLRLTHVQLSGGIEGELLTLEPDRWLSAATVPNDPLLPAQWAYATTGVLQAWTHGASGSDKIIVSVIDSGVDRNQKDLSENLWVGNGNSFGPGKRFCESTPGSCDPGDLSDSTGHGTGMAGIIGAWANNRYLVAGVNWDVSLMILKVLQENNLGSAWDVARALEFASDNGAAIVSLSLGGRCGPEELLNAIIQASATGTLVVTAAGNEYLNLCESSSEFYPPTFRRKPVCQPNDWCFRNVLVVGATTDQDARASFTNWHPQVVDLGAPGVAVVTTGLHKYWGLYEATGTSPSTALVAAGAALVASTAPECRELAEGCYDTVKRQLLSGADQKAELCRCFSGGRRLNVSHAVKDESGQQYSCSTPTDTCNPGVPPC